MPLCSLSIVDTKRAYGRRPATQPERLRRSFVQKHTLTFAREGRCVGHLKLQHNCACQSVYLIIFEQEKIMDDYQDYSVLEGEGDLAENKTFYSNFNIGQEETDDRSNNDDNIIDVDNDFEGNLESAIAEADDGDTIQIGSYTYYTDGIVIDKDITLDGTEGSVIDGRGTNQSILTLTSEASGTTVQNLHVTNGNNGIHGNGATDLTLQNVEVSNIGLDETDRYGQNNTGIMFSRADGLKISNSYIHDVGRKGIGVGDTEGAIISDLTVQNVNLAAQHSQAHDAAGVKLFNTNNATVKDSYFSDINAINIWNDTTSNTKIEGNEISNVGEDFLAPSFNDDVNISGIYNEKSSNATIKYNSGTSVDEFLVFDSTEFSSETMDFGDNDFSTYELGTQDYWVDEESEKLIATTENPGEADFSLLSDRYYEQANIG